MFTNSTIHQILFFLSVILVSTSLVTSVQAQQSATSNLVITRVGDAPLDEKPGGNWVYYCQADPQWQSNRCDMDISGCGPTSMAMIVSSLGLTKTPLEMDQIFRGPPQVRACNGQSDINAFVKSNWLQNNGFQVEAVRLDENRHLDLDQAREYLSKGFKIIASSYGKTYPCPPSGYCAVKGGKVDHIFTVFEANKDSNSFKVHDPLNCRPESPTEKADGIEKKNDFALLLAWAIRK